MTSALLAEGFYPVFLWESSDAAGELNHPSAQTDGEPTASAGQRGQDAVLHGPRHQLLPRGQRHGQDHQRRVGRQACSRCLCCGKCDSCCFFFRPTGRLDEYLACIAKIQKAVEYFQDNNPDSPELNTVVQFNWHEPRLSDSCSPG